jgi:hypothetical protein
MLLLIVAAMFGANQPAEDTTAKWGDGFVVRGDADDFGAAPDPVPIRHSAPPPLALRGLAAALGPPDRRPAHVLRVSAQGTFTEADLPAKRRKR